MKGLFFLLPEPHFPVRKHIRNKSFPIGIFLIYMLSFGGNAIYSTYLNLYMASIGFTQSQIGITVSVSTFFVLLAQMFWGVASDRAKTKNAILNFLFISCAAIILLFYVSKEYWFVLSTITLFASFYTGVSPLLDNSTLEISRAKTWNYGQVRIGGTIGYCITVLFIGLVINGKYASIFIMASGAMLICFLLSFRMPRVQGYGAGKKKTPFRALFKNKQLMALFAFYLAFSMGVSFFYSFYSIYFVSIGGTSSLVGVMMFFCAITEIPCLMLANRVVKRFGVEKVLIVSGIVTSVRWLLLFLLREPVLIIAANLLHGPGYTGFTYCIVTYIGEHVPEDLRATSQSFNVLVGNVFSRMIFGYVGGLASEMLGANNIMLASCTVMTSATVLFALWSIRSRRITYDNG